MMAEVMTVKIDAEDVMERLMDDCLYAGKSLREWIDILLKSQWIPCSERLPTEADGALLVTLDLDGYRAIRTGIYSEFSNRWFVGDMSAFCPNELVVAWMPLPEPYKAGDGSE